jgi:hypothetical protein
MSIKESDVKQLKIEPETHERLKDYKEDSDSNNLYSAVNLLLDKWEFNKDIGTLKPYEVMKEGGYTNAEKKSLRLNKETGIRFKSFSVRNNATLSNAIDLLIKREEIEHKYHSRTSELG